MIEKLIKIECENVKTEENKKENETEELDGCENRKCIKAYCIFIFLVSGKIKRTQKKRKSIDKCWGRLESLKMMFLQYDLIMLRK